ncbi:MAG: lysophospholipid acyltransferase family protein [Rhodothalassiaceae bacterium]
MRSLLFNIGFYGFTTLWATGLLLTLPFPGRGLLQRGIVLYARIVFVLARVIAGIRIEIRGREHVPEHRAALVIAKHMSDLDPIVAFYLMPDMTALAKKELFAIPVIGAILRKLGIVRVDRQAGTAHQVMPDVVREIRAQGRPLIVYPEGTRSRPGQRLKLKSGAFYLQLEGDLPAIPMATNSGLHWPKGASVRRPGTVIYEFGPPLPHLSNKAAFMAEVERRVIARSDELMRADPVWPEATGKRPAPSVT